MYNFIAFLVVNIRLSDVSNLEDCCPIAYNVFLKTYNLNLFSLLLFSGMYFKLVYELLFGFEVVYVNILLC